MPDPGFQKPMPKLEPAVDRKSYTSLFVFTACSRSASPPNLPFLVTPPNRVRVRFARQCCSGKASALLHEGLADRCGAVALQSCTRGRYARTSLRRSNTSAPVVLRGGGALDQVVAVNSRRHRRGRQPRGHKLQHRHLRRSILHRHAVCAGAGALTAAHSEPASTAVSKRNRQANTRVRAAAPGRRRR